MIDRESNRMDQWIKEEIHIRKEQDKSMNQDEGSYQLQHVYEYLLCAIATPGGQKKAAAVAETSTVIQFKRLFFDEFT